MANKCIYCGSFELREEDDRSRPPISFVPKPIYPKKYTCKKCRKTFTKEQMDNPSAAADGAAAELEATGPTEEAPASGGFSSEAATPPARASPAKPAPSGFSSESYQSPGFSSSPAPARASGFSTLESDAAVSQPQEKKSYMQIMKEKQQYQSQQFQETVAAEQQAIKPAVKPAPKPAPKPAGGPVVKPAGGPVVKPAGGPVVKPAGGPVVKPAGGPVVKPAGGPVVKPAGGPVVKPPVEPAAPLDALPADLPELDALPDLPPMEEPAQAPEAPIGDEPAFRPSAETEAAGQELPLEGPDSGPVQPAGGPVVKPAGMKPPVKPAGGPVVKPAGMKPAAPSTFQTVEPSAPAPSAFQSIETPAPKYVPPPIENEPMAAATTLVPPASSHSRLQQLLNALDTVLSGLSWPQEKKDMLKQELINLPEDEQITFLEQLGVEIPPEQKAAAVASPAAPSPPKPAPPAPVVPVPVAPPVSSPPKPTPVTPVVPVPTVPSVISPPMKPASGMSPPMQPVVSMKPPVKPPVGPVAKPAGVKPPVKPSVGPVVKPAGMKPPTKPASAPLAPASAAAVGLFNSIDQQIEQTVAGEFDLDNFLDTGLELDLGGQESSTPAAPVVPAIIPPLTPGESEVEEVKPAIKVSQISTKVEKKSEADLKREEERQKAQAATESSLVYMRLLAFEKACGIPKTYKLAEFSKMLKDLDQQILADFIVAVDNDFIIAYDDEKKQIVVSEISGPEMEILARQFEKWLRFGRL